MIRPICASLLLMSGLIGTAAQGQDPFRASPAGSALAQPGNYTLAPQTSAPGGMATSAPGGMATSAPGGVASVTYGSRNLSAASIEMDSGLIGNTGTRAFVALGAVHGPDLLPRSDGGRTGLVSHGAMVGLEKVFTDGTTVVIGGAWQRDRLQQIGHSRQASYDPVPAP